MYSRIAQMTPEETARQRNDARRSASSGERNGATRGIPISRGRWFRGSSASTRRTSRRCGKTSTARSLGALLKSARDNSLARTVCPSSCFWLILLFALISLSPRLRSDAVAVGLPDGVQAVWDIAKAYDETTPTRERICLNGLWRWQPAGASSDEVPAGSWGFFKVPGCWPGITDYMQKDSQTLYAHPGWKDVKPGGITVAWYEREMTIPIGWSGRRMSLNIEYLNSFEQTRDVLEKRLGFRVEEYGLRRVFPRVPDHPFLAGIKPENLNDWRGSATINPPRLKYEMRPRYGPTVEWAGIPVTRVWRCGNRGNVASVLIEKPARGDFLPILDGGFSLQYSPLLEYREGKGMMLFCQLDVTGRTESDPTAEALVRNILRYATDWKPVPRRKAVYAGEPAGRTCLASLGVLVRAWEPVTILAVWLADDNPGARKTATNAPTSRLPRGRRKTSY